MTKTTKKQLILSLLKSGNSLNRFEAERFGDHCLNTTISDLKKDGHQIHDVWEKVPNRFGGETPCKRYSYLGGSHE